MWKITAGLFISLDGVVEGPGDWHFPYFNDEMGVAVDGQLLDPGVPRVVRDRPALRTPRLPDRSGLDREPQRHLKSEQARVRRLAWHRDDRQTPPTRNPTMLAIERESASLTQTHVRSSSRRALTP